MSWEMPNSLTSQNHLLQHKHRATLLYSTKLGFLTCLYKNRSANSSTSWIFLSHPGPTEALRQAPPVDSFNHVQDLIKRMKAGQVDLLLIHGANPAFELPAAAGFVEAIERVPFVVSFSPFVDETAVKADLILPDHTYLEAWGYQVPAPGVDRPAVSSQQPVVRPLYDTRATADVVLALAARLGGRAAEALPWPDEVAFLQEIAGQLHGSSLGAYDASTPAGFLALLPQYGG